MNNEQLALEGAKAIISTGIEGAYDSVSCSTAGDYPSMGVSQWEGLGGRGDYLLSCIDGGSKFAGRSYSDIVGADELEELSALLGSEQGQSAQQQLLANDILNTYIPTLQEVEGFINPRCFIYSICWCPTSHNVVKIFLENRLKWGYDINDLDVLYKLFYDQYWQAADVGDEYKEGYENRAINTYNYVSNLDLSNYG